MSRTARASRVSSLLAACAGTALVAIAGAETMPDQIGARRVAAQRIRAGDIGTLKPAALSHDGRLIAFVSRNRHTSQGTCCKDVYVLDRSTGLITQESIRQDGTQPDGDSQSPSLSADGRTVAFETTAPTLLNDALPVTRRRVIARDRQKGILRAPHSQSGKELDGDSGEPVVSGNGLMVAFTSDATNLVPERNANGRQTDIYLWHLDDSTITRISVDNKGMQPAKGASHSPSISGNGELIAFVSTARLTLEDTNDVADVYLRDMRRGVTSLVSRAADGRLSDGASYSPALSADGHYVAFASKADNLVPRDRNRESDVFVYDVEGRSTMLASASSKGEAANAESRQPAMSADGRHVVYQSMASNLGSGSGCPRTTRDTNLLPDVYLFDRATQCVVRISSSASNEWWTPSVAPAIDGSGTVVAFSSTEPDREDDLSTDFDLFLFVRPGRDTSRYGPEGPQRAH
jgi:Tol biopolymer transport system component